MYKVNRFTKSSSDIVCINKLLLCRQVLFQMLHCKVPIICFNAKDFLRTLLQVYGNEISWKQGNYLIYYLILSSLCF